MNANRSTEEQVRQRAYEVYLLNGSQAGHEVDNWLQAEYELMQLPVRSIAELEQPMRKQGSRLSVVALVQAAVVLGVRALPHFKG